MYQAELNERGGLKPSRCGFIDLIVSAARKDLITNGHNLICLGCPFLWGPGTKCSKQERPFWYDIRRYLQPRVEFIHTVDALYNTIPHPVVTVHLR